MDERKTVNLLFTCSGTADVGELADRAVRQVARQGQAAMSCLASIGARDSDIMFNARLADRVLLVDGCPKACSLRTFEQAALNRPVQWFNLSEIGLRKGASPVTPEAVQQVVGKISAMLQVLDHPSIRPKDGAPPVSP